MTGFDFVSTAFGAATFGAVLAVVALPVGALLAGDSAAAVVSGFSATLRFAGAGLA